MKLGDLKKNNGRYSHLAKYLNDQTQKNLSDDDVLTDEDILLVICVMLPIFSSTCLISQLTPAQNEENLELLLKMKPFSLARVQNLVADLHLYQLLNPASFTRVLKGITNKLPEVKASTLLKKSGRGMSSRSEWILDNSMHFFRESETYAEGNFGKIKIGYGSRESTAPLFSIKKLIRDEIECWRAEGKSEDKPDIPQKVEAQREVKHQCLLGRESAFFKHSNSYQVVSTWQKGRKLNKHFRALSFESALACAKDVLEDLFILHKNDRVHGDVKRQNCVLTDDPVPTMHLIDFGGSRKIKNSPKNFAWTLEYSDRTAANYSFCDDIYSMGLVIAYLFPYIYTTTEHLQYTTINRNYSSYFFASASAKAIVNLVEAMTAQTRDQRCSCEDALNYCRELITNLPALNDEILKKISDATINRSHLTAEDVIHGTYRAFKAC